jgi:hypothetical protein
MERKYVYQNRNGVRRTLIIDEEKPFSPIIQVEQNLDEILAGIKRDRDTVRPGSVNKHVARVPVEVYELSIHQEWGEDDWKKWLNDPDNEKFRIWPGRV